MSVDKTIFSGEPGTSGREVFEDATVPRPQDGLVSNQTPVAGGQGTAAGSGARNAGEHGVGIGAGNDHVGHSHSHHHHDHSSSHQHTGIAQAETIGAGAGAQTAETFTGHGSQGHHHSTTGDRTGSLDQDASLYERTGTGGPRTGGAAGTDRFDSDNVRGPTGSKDAYAGVEDDRERTAGKGTGGLMGVLGTSDKDFTGPDTLPKTGMSAYQDNQANYKSNTSGPGGASALTGREGNFSENPVSRAEGGVHGQGVTGTHGSSTTSGLDSTSGPAGKTVSGHGAAEEGTEHKGFIQKVKDML